MSVMKFKTNAKCGGCVAAIGDKLNKIMSPDNWSIDLSKPEKVLTVTTELPAATIIKAVTDAGFKAEQLL
ncbi:heavy-metal-associated domain-containing protein [Parabacteroides bouchesdurhonensis]|uniref:heavy-metal-associated domain-containing protein n=1 Tax=Parabacteroides bouchesdurhonensis TaxID=1936995 RepID=UPI000E50217D|nr:cation transporter [Parabacteroides bouchesdurhonensis]RHJ90427.1 heavy metal transport/detoxification protein [Bacteroides sp. AM07-16]